MKKVYAFLKTVLAFRMTDVIEAVMSKVAIYSPTLEDYLGSDAEAKNAGRRYQFVNGSPSAQRTHTSNHKSVKRK